MPWSIRPYACGVSALRDFVQPRRLLGAGWVYGGLTALLTVLLTACWRRCWRGAGRGRDPRPLSSQMTDPVAERRWDV